MSRRVAQVSLVVRVPLPHTVTPRRAKEWIERQVRDGDLPIGTKLILTEALTISDTKEDPT